MTGTSLTTTLDRMVFKREVENFRVIEGDLFLFDIDKVYKYRGPRTRFGKSPSMLMMNAGERGSRLRGLIPERTSTGAYDAQDLDQHTLMYIPPF